MWRDEGMKALALKGRKVLVGVAIADCLARWAAKHFRQAYLSDKARPHASRWPQRSFFAVRSVPRSGHGLSLRAGRSKESETEYFGQRWCASGIDDHGPFL
jgi:hypothetical protein